MEVFDSCTISGNKYELVKIDGKNVVLKNGVHATTRELSHSLGVSRTCISARIKRGHSLVACLSAKDSKYWCDLRLQGGGRKWKDEEVQAMVDMHEKGMSQQDIADALGRPLGSIYNASAKAGLSFRRRWEDEEIEYLKENYGIEKAAIIAIKLNRTDEAVITFAQKIGIKSKLARGKRPHPITGRGAV